MGISSQANAAGAGAGTGAWGAWGNRVRNVLAGARATRGAPVEARGVVQAAAAKCHALGMVENPPEQVEQVAAVPQADDWDDDWQPAPSLPPAPAVAPKEVQGPPIWASVRAEPWEDRYEKAVRDAGGDPLLFRALARHTRGVEAAVELSGGDLITFVFRMGGIFDRNYPFSSVRPKGRKGRRRPLRWDSYLDARGRVVLAYLRDGNRTYTFRRQPEGDYVVRVKYHGPRRGACHTRRPRGGDDGRGAAGRGEPAGAGPGRGGAGP
jgi:hypothetical protein